MPEIFEHLKFVRDTPCFYIRALCHCAANELHKFNKKTLLKVIRGQWEYNRQETRTTSLARYCTFYLPRTICQAWTITLCRVCFRKLHFSAKSHCFSKWEELSIKELSTAANTKIKRTSAVSFFFLPSAPAYLACRGFVTRSIHRGLQNLGKERDCSQSRYNVFSSFFFCFLFFYFDSFLVEHHKRICGF